jgi:flagellar basal-body rod protein FlgF
MIKALDSSRQAMQVQLRRHEVTANNLANVNTPGFKRELSMVTALEAPASGDAGPGAQSAPRELLVEGRPNLAGGSLSATGNPLDVALAGEGFFQVQSPDGARLTRDGSFTLDPQGLLIHSSGYPVLVDGGSVQLSGLPSILQDGSILDGENPAGQLSIVKVGEGGHLMREGENLFRVEGGTEEMEAGDIQVASGFLEGSNVDPIREMVNMIQAFRVYELAQKAANAADQTLQIAVNRVGVLR